ncbi:hypothetical protein BDF19DRAFT_451813 [Syncephalis fuscata]|nr:hypothetical protein BDF19DRAFT_451813 [Syncephalis fuscata]
MAQSSSASEIALANLHAFDCLLHWRINLQLLLAARELTDEPDGTSRLSSSVHLLESKQIPLYNERYNSADYKAQILRISAVINDLKTKVENDINNMIVLRWEISELLALVCDRYTARQNSTFTSTNELDATRSQEDKAKSKSIQLQSNQSPRHLLNNLPTNGVISSTSDLLSPGCCRPRSSDEQLLGLLAVLPAFVACSADIFVDMATKTRIEWFKLLLNLQTQVRIFCDQQNISTLIETAFLLETQSEFKDLLELDQKAFVNYKKIRKERMNEILGTGPEETVDNHLLQLNNKYIEQEVMDALLVFIRGLYLKLEKPILFQHSSTSIQSLHPYKRAMLASPTTDALSLVDDLYVQHEFANSLDRIHGIKTYDRKDNNNNNMSDLDVNDQMSDDYNDDDDEMI